MRLRLPADPAADGELVRRFVAGRDEAAFAELVRRHGPLVRGVCRRMLGAADADDAAQAVFLTLARSAGRVRDGARLSGWLHAVSVRVCRKAWRRRASGGVHPRRPAAVADPADEASWREVAAAVDAALAALPEKLRLPLVLCYLDGLTRDEAAAKLGWSLDTLRGRLDRGRAKLRAALTRRGFGLPAGLLAVLLTSPRGDAAMWAAGVARSVFNPAGPPAAVAGLTVGVTSAMRTKLALLVGLPLLAAGGFGVAPAARQPPPPAPAAAARPPFVGRWECVLAYPDGSGRHSYVLTVEDDQHLTQQITGTGPGFVSTTRVRCRYRLTDTDLFLTRLEQWVGEEPVPLKPADTAGQRYAAKWGTAGGKPWLELKPADSPDARTLRYAPTDPPPPAAVPEVLRGERKPPTKEPKYQDKPLYLELAFGPTAALRAWLVLDGDRVYLDRNGNGDLTDDEDSPARDLGLAAKGPDGRPRGGNFALGVVEDRAREVIYGEIALMTVNTGTGRTAAAFRLRVDGKHDQKAGLTDLFLSPDPKAARVVHFDADRWAVSAPTGSLTAGRKQWLAVSLGTPGAGPGSFVTRANFDFPKEKNPVGEFRFPGVAAPVRVAFDRREMSELGVWDQFKGEVAVPAGAGKGPARLTLTFPDCPAGAVPAAEYEVWYFPKPADKP